MTINLSKARKGDRFEARNGDVWEFIEYDGPGRQPYTLRTGSRATTFDVNGHYWPGCTESENDLIRPLDIHLAASSETTASLALDTPAPEARVDDPVCTDCGGTGITYQTERRCACQGEIAEAKAHMGPIGWLFLNGNDETEYSESHPIESGEDAYARDIQPATAENLKATLLIAWEVSAEYERRADEASTRIETLARALEEAGKVIGPFAAACTISSHEDGVHIDDSIAATKIKFGHLRAARDWRNRDGGAGA